MSIIRGTTPTLEFVLPFDAGTLVDAYVTISQNNVVMVDKPLTVCRCDGQKLSVTLTQEETLMLDCNCISEIQIRAKTRAGDVIASNIIRASTSRILKEGVI